MALNVRYKIVVMLIVIMVVVLAALLFFKKESSSDLQSTEDAYVKADATAVTTQISGIIRQVNIQDYQHVKAGDPLILLDDDQASIQVKSAEAHLATQQAELMRVEAKMVQQKSVIHQAEANVNKEKSLLTLAQQNLKRFTRLAADGSGTVQEHQNAQANFDAQQALVSTRIAVLQNAKDEVAVLKANIAKIKADMVFAEAEVDQAKLKQSYTTVSAPIEGYIMQKKARVGAYSEVGKSLLMIVPLSAIYIEANYRETQLKNIQAGQIVDIKVDALPGVKLKGVVESIGPASGASIASVASHNATGNFTKIVQRLPVRIKLDSNQADFEKLRVGMSVIPSIQTRKQ